MRNLLIRLISSIIFILILPLLVILGLIIKLRYPGSIFYLQQREGKDRKVFWIWKLRTMKANADFILVDILQKNEQMAKEMKEFGCLRNDPRVAGPIAKLARQFSIDELPQLINVIKGDMTLVGPRPLELYLANTLDDDRRMRRNAVKPGITGLWQIGPRSEVNIRQMQFYDNLYLRKRCFTLDIYIICKTAGAVIRRTGL